jgi:hypothetical protein
MWGGCVYGVLCERRSLPFEQSFFLQQEPQLCVPNGVAPILKPDLCSKRNQICSSFNAVVRIMLVDLVTYNELVKIMNTLLVIITNIFV